MTALRWAGFGPRCATAPARVDDGDPLPVRADPIEEAQRSNVSLAMISLWIWLVPS